MRAVEKIEVISAADLMAVRASLKDRGEHFRYKLLIGGGYLIEVLEPEPDECSKCGNVNLNDDGSCPACLTGKASGKHWSKADNEHLEQACSTWADRDEELPEHQAEQVAKELGRSTAAVLARYRMYRKRQGPWADPARTEPVSHQPEQEQPEQSVTAGEAPF